MSGLSVCLSMSIAVILLGSSSFVQDGGWVVEFWITLCKAMFLMAHMDFVEPNMHLHANGVIGVTNHVLLYMYDK